MSDPFATQMRWWRTFGDIWTVPLPTGSMVFVAHPDLAQHLVNGHLDHGEMNLLTEPAQGKGITLQHGEQWRRTRTLMQPMFSIRALRELSGLMVEAIVERLAHLDARATSGGEFDLAKFLGEITIRVLFHAMFSDEFSDTEIDCAVARLDTISVYKGELLTSGWRQPGTAIESELVGKRAAAELDELLYGAIARRRAGRSGEPDLLGRLIAAVDADGNGFTDTEIRNELTVLFFGGYETTQWAMAWALAMLALDEDVRGAVVAEVDRVLGDDLPTADHLPRLELLRATVNEALRYQATLLLPRQLEHDDVIGGYHIPTRSMVVASTWVIHRRPDLWRDPDRFDPSRFVGVEAAEMHKYQMLSFGGGPRRCLGVNLAMYEAQFALALFLRRFTYTVPDDWQPVHRQQYSVVIDGGLPVRVAHRVTG
jgi:cytochrome P450